MSKKQSRLHAPAFVWIGIIALRCLFWFEIQAELEVATIALDALLMFLGAKIFAETLMTPTRILGNPWCKAQAALVLPILALVWFTPVGEKLGATFRGWRLGGAEVHAWATPATEQSVPAAGCGEPLGQIASTRATMGSIPLGLRSPGSSDNWHASLKILAQNH